MPTLSGKSAFITGAASGIGRAAALRFAEQGCAVAIADLAQQQESAAKVVDEIRRAGGRAIFVPCDVAEPQQVQSAVDQAAAELGRLDIVLANAGINGVWAPLEELQPHEWNQTLAINLTGTWLTLRYCVPHLQKSGGGSIIITSSVNGTRTFSNPGSSAYSASKAGQIALMKMAAFELARYNIRVNAVCPGGIHTNISQRTWQRDTDELKVRVEFPPGLAALDQIGEPREVADVCLFLASDLSRHVSGVEIYVDRGSSLVR